MRISDWSSDVCSSDLLGRAKLQLSGYRRSEGVRAGRWREACAVSCRHSLDRNHGHGFGLRPDRNSDMVTMAAVKIGRRLGRVGRAVVILFREVLATADRCNSAEIGRAHVCTPVTNAQLVCRLLLDKKKQKQQIKQQ